MQKREILIILVLTLIPFVTANLAPKLNELPEQISLCENSTFSLEIQATDPDADQINFEIYPKNPFFIFNNELFTKPLTKQNVGEHKISIVASDENHLDRKVILFKILPINNPPALADTKVQTIDLNQNPNFHLELQATDQETSTNELNFNVNFKSGERIFDISNEGIIDATLDESKIGSYIVETCVRDKEVKSDKSLCPDSEQKLTCDEFHLTVTNQNRPPTITVHRPSANSINTTVGKNILFNISTFDPDGSKPDVFWYVDGVLENSASGLESTTQTFEKRFRCTATRKHEIKLEITDGLLNDTILWQITTEPDGNCTEETTETNCTEKWACSEWNICQHAEQSLNLNIIPREKYQAVSETCNSLGLPEETCGFQIRTCADANSCKTAEQKPEEIRACHFTLNPSCNDNIQNCHDNLCETNVDCGGSCSACPTCNDGIKNQGEVGKDCEGPCETACPTFLQELISKILIVISIILAIGLVGFVVYKLRKIIHMEVELKKPISL